MPNKWGLSEGRSEGCSEEKEGQRALALGFLARRASSRSTASATRSLAMSA